ncbi:hypothetical protein [Ralstonia sp. 1B3]|uniref:hypothetical protein n=1 Tax=Ralstonia sp. 1B3 TaxID=2997421 RepID=UPI002FCC2C56
MSRDADEAIVLSPPTTSDNAGGRIDQPRRSFIVQAGLLSAALWGTSAGAVGTRSAARIARSVIDRSCRVSGQRLDDLVAKAYPLFNKPAILPTFDASRTVPASTWTCIGSLRTPWCRKPANDCA